jgi:hypothetical protein
MTQDDIDLLIRAAKKSHIRFDEDRVTPHPVSGTFFGLWLTYDREPTEYDDRYWNPLSKRHQAFALMVQHGLKVGPPKYKGFGASAGNHTVFRDGLSAELLTCRAIVTAVGNA